MYTIIFLSIVAFGIGWFVIDFQKYKKQKEKETINKIKNNINAVTFIFSTPFLIYHEIYKGNLRFPLTPSLSGETTFVNYLSNLVKIIKFI